MASMNYEQFLIENEHYTYRSLEESGRVKLDGASIIFAYSADAEIAVDGYKSIQLTKGSYLELPSSSVMKYIIRGSGYVVLLTNRSRQSLLEELQDKSLENDSYKVAKPWGRELWITGSSPKHSMVLKLIEIKKGTRTSLQVHQQKYESNFLCKGEAVFRYSSTRYNGRGELYAISERTINSPTILDVEPMTIHQLEAKTDIVLIEASTDHWDDVIRLQDDSCRSDGRIDSEHTR